MKITFYKLLVKLRSFYRSTPIVTRVDVDSIIDENKNLMKEIRKNRMRYHQKMKSLRLN